MHFVRDLGRTARVERDIPPAGPRPSDGQRQSPAQTGQLPPLPAGPVEHETREQTDRQEECRFRSLLGQRQGLTLLDEEEYDADIAAPHDHTEAEDIEEARHPDQQEQAHQEAVRNQRASFRHEIDHEAEEDDRASPWKIEVARIPAEPRVPAQVGNQPEREVIEDGDRRQPAPSCKAPLPKPARAEEQSDEQPKRDANEREEDAALLTRAPAQTSLRAVPDCLLSPGVELRHLRRMSLPLHLPASIRDLMSRQHHAGSNTSTGADKTPASTVLGPLSS